MIEKFSKHFKYIESFQYIEQHLIDEFICFMTNVSNINNQFEYFNINDQTQGYFNEYVICG